MKCGKCGGPLAQKAVDLNGEKWCAVCVGEEMGLPDAPLVDMNENFDTAAVNMVENMNLDELNVIETGRAAKADTDTSTATVSFDDLDLDDDQ